MDGLYHWDLETFRAVNLGLRAVWLDHVSAAVSISGLGILQALFVVAWYPWPALRRLVVPTVVAIAVSGILLADVAKLIFARDRPTYLAFAHVLEDVHRRSFPSGHTATSFGLATMLALLTMGTRQRWIGPVALLYATAVGVSRVYQGAHWPTDCLAGAALGALGAGVVYRVFEKKGWLDLEGREKKAARPM